jgi:hypothetical protein
LNCLPPFPPQNQKSCRTWACSSCGWSLHGYVCVCMCLYVFYVMCIREGEREGCSSFRTGVYKADYLLLDWSLGNIFHTSLGTNHVTKRRRPMRKARSSVSKRCVCALNGLIDRRPGHTHTHTLLQVHTVRIHTHPPSFARREVELGIHMVLSPCRERQTDRQTQRHRDIWSGLLTYHGQREN